MLLAVSFLMFLRSILLSSSGSAVSLLGLLDCEDEGIMIHQNVRNYTPSDTVTSQKNLQQHCCEKLRFVSCQLHLEFLILVCSGANSCPVGTFQLLRRYDRFLGWAQDVLYALPTVMAVITGVWLFAVILGRSHYLLFTLAAAMQPRMLVTFDEELNPLPVPVRVGLVSFTNCYLAQQISVSYSRIPLIWHSRLLGSWGK